MNFIIVKDFSIGDTMGCIPPTLIVEVDGKEYEILNFRNYYYCIKGNSLAGRGGQIPVDTPGIKEQFDRVICNCLANELESGRSYQVSDPSDAIAKFLEATESFYRGI